ncbi:hypothetical protein L1887_25197 [Cichorium endivia]|nr:hypothetical protein L1887_25197 [Cichorium endivia]
MREEGFSSSGDPFLSPNSPSLPPPPPTAAASSAGASSPAVPTNAGSTDWLGHGHGSKAGSLSRISSQPTWISLSTSAHGSALGSSQPSCRPWERGDLLKRLSTFRPANWFGKPKAASSLACAGRGWMNVDVDKIQCESCGANLKYNAPDSFSTPHGEDFGNQLDEGHNVTCPWRGNSCAESLVQFPPTPPSALIGGYKDRIDGLLQFPFLPLVAPSALDQMKVSRGPEIDRFLAQSDMENSKDVLCIYSRAQNLISLCGWEPRWLPNVQDCEENSAQSARNGGSFSPIKDHKKDSLKNESRSPLLDCSLCGATVRILDFIHVNRPSRFAPTNIDVPETSKKILITRGISAASGISGWVEEHTEDIDEAATTGQKRPLSDLYQDPNLGQAAGSEVGNRAASYESRGPNEGGSTVDRPHGIIDSVEGVVIDRDGDEVNDSKMSYKFARVSYRRDSSGAGPSRVSYFENDRTAPVTKDSARASSVIAMDTYCHSDDDNDSMESVENHPGYGDEVNYPQGQNSTNDEEVLNVVGKDGFTLAVSGGSVGMGASHEAEIHGSDGLIRRTGSVVGDMEGGTGVSVTENQGQTGNFVPGVTESQTDSDVNLLPHEQSSHPSLSCNAVVCSGFEASRDEVTNDECGYPNYPPANGLGPPNGESNFEEPVEFDPIKHHNLYCPWVNGNVAAAGVGVGPTSSGSGLALCGWQLTLDALDGFQGSEPNQTVESESAASLYKDDHDHQVSGRKLMARHSFNKSHG